MPARRRVLPVLLAALLLVVPAWRATHARGRHAKRSITLVTPAGGERTAEALDLTFVFFERVYYHKHAPRAEDPCGRRIDVEDRRRECRCVRFQDWSRVKFKLVRQIEISYPAGERAARLRLTMRTGKVREVSAADLFGGQGPFGPRFAATVEGEIREFPLIRGTGTGDDWPEERLLRILFLRPSAPAHR